MANGKIADFVDGSLVILESVEKALSEEFILDNFKIEKCSVEKYREILAYIGGDEEKLKYSRYFYNEDLSEELLSDMGSNVSQKGITLNDCNVLRFILRNQQDIESYMPIINSLYNKLLRIQIDVKGAEGIFLLLLLFYKYFKEEENFIAKLRKLIRNGNLFYYFQEAIGEENNKIVAFIILINLVIQEDISFNLNSQQRDVASSGYNKYKRFINDNFPGKDDVLKNMINMMDDYSYLFNEILSSLEGYNEYEKEIIRAILKDYYQEYKDKINQHLNPNFLECNNFIRETFADNNNYEEITKSILKEKSVVELVEGAEFDVEDENHCSFAESILSLNLGNKKFADWVNDGILDLDEEDWETQISQNAFLPNIIMCLTKQYKKSFETSLKKALESLAAKAIESGRCIGGKEKMKVFIDSLNSKSLEVFRRDIIKMLVENSESNLSGLIEAFDYAFQDCSILKDYADEFIRVYLTKKVDAGKIEEIIWGGNLLEKCKLYDRRLKGIKADVADLKGEVKLKMDKTDDEELLNVLKELRNSLQ